MRKIQEILRLHFELKLPQRQIARSVRLSQSGVHDCLARFQRAQLAWPLPAELTQPELEARLYPAPAQPARPCPAHPAPDFARIDNELRSHKHTTLQLLWEEYRAQQPDGYSYSRFCHLFERWRQSQDLVMRQTYQAGERLFVDWAGSKIPIRDRHRAAIHEASLFLAVLGASSYTYAEARWSQTSADWIGAHIHAFEFFQGTPELLIPDNLKTGVAKPHRYDPDLNPTYREMAIHYGAGVLPARVRKARDKAKVEAGVLLAQRWIVAALRHRAFFSLEELNQAIAELRDKLNQRPFKKRPGSRASAFAAIDRPALRALPAERFEMADWSKASVNIDYHIQYDHSFYSVPYPLARQAVEVRATPATVEIFHQGVRVASHVRARQPHTAVTTPEHRPKAHQAHLDWPPSRMIEWARASGPHTAELVEKILAAQPHPEMGYRACLGLIRLGERYSVERLEAAAARALAAGAIRYQSVKSMLESGLDRQPLEAAEPFRGGAAHDNIRGADYFE